MVRPARFTANLQTAGSNRFQQPNAADGDLQPQALREFDMLVQALRAAGVNVVVFEDTLEPHTPDSIFPNNWLSLHADGTAVLYPMFAENRRWERRPELLRALVTEHGFRVDRVIDLAYHEAADRYLEGTGSLVLDRTNHVAYACLSARTDSRVLEDFASRLGYEVVTFHAVDISGSAIYHTNVMLSVGRRIAVLCSECVRPDDRDGLRQRLSGGGRTILDLTYEQLASFAGNVLELESATRGSVVAMSDQAWNALTDAQRLLLEGCIDRVVRTPIPTIEQFGGGSVRCMLAEIHLPRA
jgi:hypothetical protein